MWGRGALLAACLTALIGCGTSEEVFYTSITLARVMVDVSVSFGAGHPVAGATISGSVIGIPGTIAPSPPISLGATDTLGVLRGMVDLGSTPTFTGTLILTVEPPAGSGLRPDTLTLPDTRFVEVLSGAVPDTVRTAFSLRES